jgi:predicted trehalose synthase
VSTPASATQRAVEAALADWMPRQRWYAGKAHTPSLRRVGGWRRADPDGAAEVEVVLLADEAATPPVVYQVPLTFRDCRLPEADDALVTRLPDTLAARGWVYDGPHDPAYVRALVTEVLGHHEPAAVLLDSSVLRGEQSNTSVVCQMRGADPVIVKVFRTLAPGPNPDVELTTGLYAVGSHDVPTPRGSAQAVWAGSGEPGYTASAQTFVPGVEDAWRVALRAASDGTDFTAAARELGEVTARIHRDLARAFPTVEATPANLRALRTSVEGRLRTAGEAAPELLEWSADVHALVASLDERDWPRLQRIHGDYHLGQVLCTGEHGWLALDFEGEPLRPLAERRRPDLPVRDVAGMLRSFDYAAGSVAATSGISRLDWASACRRAFLQGYGSGLEEATAGDRLLRALELDKALYEVGYEARHRPSWLQIPVRAVDRLLHPRGA